MEQQTMEQQKRLKKCGNPLGLLLTVAIGFALYFLLSLAPVIQSSSAYTDLISSISTPSNQVTWFLMNFTEGDFYAGPIASIFMIVGAALAWLLSIRKTKYGGIEICYGSARIWPWIFASQVFSLLLTEFAFGYIRLFDLGNTWIPTFIVIVSVPPALTLMYGPGLKTLLTVSILGAAICTPTAYWISQATANLGIPGAANNVMAMVVSGIIAGSVCRVLPWMTKKDIKPTDNPNAPETNYSSVTWVLRRTIADLTEPQFYGNDIAAAFLLVGVCIEWFLNPSLLTGGALQLPAIILSQFISGGIGVFLYTGKYQERGWYGTYVPVVCTAPACILLHGATMPIILISSILGGVIGAPIAQWIDDRRSSSIPGTVSNVAAMAISTILVSAIISCIPWI